MAAYRRIGSIRKIETLLLFPKFGRLIKAATIKGRAQKIWKFLMAFAMKRGSQVQLMFFNFWRKNHLQSLPGCHLTPSKIPIEKRVEPWVIFTRTNILEHWFFPWVPSRALWSLFLFHLYEADVFFSLCCIELFRHKWIGSLAGWVACHKQQQIFHALSSVSDSEPGKNVDKFQGRTQSGHNTDLY